MDNIEKWIIDHRTIWDSHEAPTQTWEGIAQKLDKDLRQKRKLKWWTRCLVAGILIGLVFVYYHYTQKPATTIEDPLMFAQMEDYKQSEQFFESQSEMYKSELVALGVEMSVLADIEHLDLIEAELKQELIHTQGEYRYAVLQALIQNHLTQVSLLQELITELNQAKQNEKLYQNL